VKAVGTQIDGGDDSGLEKGGMSSLICGDETTNVSSRSGVSG
jgi:hypothetical protein